MSTFIQIRREMRQGCMLSLLLFNLYSIFQEALVDETAGIKVNEVWVNNIRYADDAVLIADNINDLQNLLNVVEKQRVNELNINTKKT